MTPELRLLVWSAVLGLVQVLLTGMANTAQNGAAYGMGSRDDQKKLTGVPGRIERALRNLLETYPFFAVAVIAAHLLDRHNALTWWGTTLYFWARVVYLPIYAAGVPVVRSVVWGVALVGIVLVLLGLT